MGKKAATSGLPNPDHFLALRSPDLASLKPPRGPPGKIRSGLEDSVDWAKDH
jgi:hypothetical protein